MEDFKITTPVIYIIFNRPDCVEKSFESIRFAKTNMLYIVADGPRENVPEDVYKCNQCREIVDNINWDCKVTRIYSSINLGCGLRPASGIKEVFKCEEMAIIIEDDCVPSQDFYRFCQEMLNKYKDDERIYSVSGMNFGITSCDGADYYFTHLNNTWGWATWKRSWEKYDFDIKSFPEIINENYLSELFEDRDVNRYWYESFDKVFSKELTSAWDYQYLYNSFLVKGLHIYPNKNLVKYIGLTGDATHEYKSDNDDLYIAINGTELMTFPLIDPQIIDNNKVLEKAQLKDIFNIKFTNLNTFSEWISRHTEELDNAKKIIIYGAGNWGKRFALELIEKGKTNFEFLVSERGEKNTLFGKKISEIEEYKDKKGNLIIVALAEKHRLDVRKTLENHNVDSFLFLKSDNEIYSKEYQLKPLDEKKILLITSVEYAGHGKNIVKELLKIRPDIKIGWVDKNGSDVQMNHVQRVVYDYPKEFYEYYYNAKYFLTDTGCKTYRDGQVKIQMKHWSSVTLKMFGYDELEYRADEEGAHGVNGWDNIDYLFVGSEFDEKTCRSGFKYNGPAIYVGSPRSDILFDNNYDYEQVRTKYSLESDKRYIMYAPTFRMKDSASDDCIFINDLDFNLLKESLDKKFGGDWNILLRLHPFVSKESKNIEKPDFVIDVSGYYDGEELVGISDALITDYSSIMFEPAYVNKPVFLFATDLEKYLSEERGFYIDYYDLPFSIAESNEQLSKNILTYDEDVYIRTITEFFGKYGIHEDGRAARRAAEFISKLIPE